MSLSVPLFLRPSLYGSVFDYLTPTPLCLFLSFTVALTLGKVFDAADKEVSDASVGKKADKKPTKDAGEAMGDMLSNFFGGGKK